MDQYLPLVIISFIAAFVATPLSGRIAFHTGYIDKPKPHKMHVRPIPLLGGLAIYLSLCVAITQINFSAEALQMAAVAAGATLLMLIGLLDDRRGVSPRIKLLAQIVAAGAVTVTGLQVHLFPWPVVNIVITLFWFIGITNAINLMDNMDGLAAGISAVAALFFTILAAAAGQGLVASLAAAVTGASLGFLYYNVPPAMIFMGDTGSLLLGFLLAVIGVKYSPRELTLGSTWMAPIVILGLPIFDTTLVTFARLMSRRPVSRGGTDHTSHRLARLGLGINRAVLTMYLAAGMLGVLAVLMTHSLPGMATGLFLALLAVGFVSLLILERAEPIPPVDPLVVILAGDSQALSAIRSARILSSHLAVVASPRSTTADLRSYLRALAVEQEAFSRWLDGGVGDAIGEPDAWHELYRLAGKVIPISDQKNLERLPELFREAGLIVVCRGGGWPAEIRPLLAEVSGRLTAAPEADSAGVPSLPAAVWNDPDGLERAMEDAILGKTRKEKPS
jgi:UDP-GlcNAc:undecaprenyl-phosphate GlcNAc-1-phosphate transferase